MKGRRGGSPSLPPSLRSFTSSYQMREVSGKLVDVFIEFVVREKISKFRRKICWTFVILTKNDLCCRFRKVCKVFVDL
jgi:hypothetical protein